MKKATAKTAKKITTRARRRARIRARVKGTALRPRFAVFRSNRALYVQLIDDARSTTLVAADSRTDGGKTLKDRAVALGAIVGSKAKAKGIEKVVFDRGGFQYEGVIAACADAARAAGLVF